MGYILPLKFIFGCDTSWKNRIRIKQKSVGTIPVYVAAV